jgi:oligopeptide/dipeptide ABC transporter ATP-binding protein
VIIQRQVAAVHAVDGISFGIRKGETLGLVGESGSGKSTTARLLLRLLDLTSGRVELEDEDITTVTGAQLRDVRQKMQMIFQDPYASLDPRMTVRDIVGEPLVIWNRWKNKGPARVAELLERVGLNPDHANRFPHEFSGGQRQRIGIARALALQPKLIVCDEPVSALDVSVQAQILNLLEDMKARYGLTLIFIAHDLAVVKNVSDRVAVMYLGKLCEVAPPDELYRQPAHPYSSALLSAIPVPDPESTAVRDEESGIGGELPSPIDPPSGCRFRTRCPRAQQRCADDEPSVREVAKGHFVACHYPLLGDQAPPSGPVESAVAVGASTG